MSIAALVKSMMEAGAPQEAILIAIQAVEAATQKRQVQSANAQRQARFRERKKDATSLSNEDNSGASNVTDNVTAVTPVTLQSVTPVTVSNVTSVTPRVCEPARVLCGEEVSILPLENTTYSIPKGISEPEAERRKPRVRPTRLLKDFEPTPAMRNFAKRHGFSEAETNAEGEAIRDWSLSSPHGAKLDWEATWRTWINRRATEKQARAGPANGSPSLFSKPGTDPYGPERSASAASKRQLEAIQRGEDPFDAIKRRYMPDKPGGSDISGEPVVRLLPPVGRG